MISRSDQDLIQIYQTYLQVLLLLATDEYPDHHDHVNL